MSCCRLLLALVLLAAAARPAPAGIIFGRHSKPNPAERVPQLLATLRSDPNEGNRANAARELREYDITAFPEVVPVLIDVVRNDAKPGVRGEAAQTLGKIRPASQEVGVALEAATHDPALRVRLQARSALFSYHIGRYRSPAKPNEAAAVPPAVNTKGTSQTPRAGQTRRLLAPPLPATSPGQATGETPPPPLAPPLPPPAASNPASSPAPKTPAPVPPAETPKLQSPPQPQPPPQEPADEGPELPPG